MRYPFGIAELLDEHQRVRLEAVNVSFGNDYAPSAAGLIVGWAAEASRLFDERERSPEDRDTWGGHDYIGALYLRSRVQRALEQLDADLAVPASAVVERFDDLLRSFTEPDERAVLPRFADEELGEEWWWTRIPTSGPVRAELDDFARSCP